MSAKLTIGRSLDGGLARVIMGEFILDPERLNQMVVDKLPLPEKNQAYEIRYGRHTLWYDGKANVVYIGRE